MRKFGHVLIAALAGGALAFGSVHAWAYWPLGVVCAALGVWGIHATGGWRRLRGKALPIALAVVAAAIAVQLLPMPLRALGVVSPAVSRFLIDYDLRYAMDPPAWHAFSISPNATLVSLMLYVLFAVFLIGLARVVDRLGLMWLVGSITALGLILALFGVIQRAFAPADGHQQFMYGLWRPVYGGSVFGPFINRNHFAGWMVMALPLVLGSFAGGLAAARRSFGFSWPGWMRWMTMPEASRSMVVAFAGLAMAAALVITGSRSGIAAFAVAVVVFIYFVARHASTPAARRVGLVGLAVLLGGAVLWAGTSRTIARFALSSADMPTRVTAWQDTVRIVHDFPVTGTGLGTYVYSMLVYQTGQRRLIFFQAHNDYLQLAAEGGLLVGIPMLLLLGVIVREIWRRTAEGDPDASAQWIRRGAIAGLIGIAAQSLVEFSLQMPGNTAFFIVLIAIAVHRASPPAHAHRV